MEREIRKFLEKLHERFNLLVRVLPVFPFESDDEFQTFERSLENEDLANYLRAELMDAKVTDGKSFVKQVLRRLFTNEVALKYCYKGGSKTDKKPIKDFKFMEILKECFKKHFENESEELFWKYVQEFFDYAQNSETKKNKKNDDNVKKPM